MDKIVVGKILGKRGIKGELKIQCFADSPDFFNKLEYVYCNDIKYNKKQVRAIGKSVAMLLEGVDSPEKADAVLGQEIYIFENDLPLPPKGRYYIKDLIGLDVFDEKRGHLGTVKDVLNTGGGDLYEILLKNSKTALIPAVPEFIKKVDISGQRIDVCLIEGLIV